MRTASILGFLAFASPVAAAGLSVDRLAPSWSALPSTHFSPWSVAPTGRILTAHPGSIPAGVVAQALASAANATERRDVVLNEIAQGWDPVRRSALEDLRDAQRGFAAAAGGDTEARGQRFSALVRQVVDDNGRSVAREPSDGEAALGQAYDKVIREAPDTRLPSIEASENAWTAYRDAFDRFALSMDRPDAAKVIRNDLAQHRAEELEAETAQ